MEGTPTGLQGKIQNQPRVGENKGGGAALGTVLFLQIERQQDGSSGWGLKMQV